MKTRILFAISAILCFSCLSFAQQEEKSSNFQVVASGGIGFTKVKTEVQPGYDLNLSSAEILLNYKFTNVYGIASGIGLTRLSGNGFNNTGMFYSERDALKIPLLFTIDQKFLEKFFLFGNIGSYAQTLTRDRLTYTGLGESDVLKGWNFGMQIGAGFGLYIYDNLGFGINFQGQSDFSKLETSEGKSFSDSQKHKNLNSISLFFKYDL